MLEKWTVWSFRQSWTYKFIYNIENILVNMKRTRIVSRNFEMVFGIIGSIIGIFSGSFLIFLESFGQAHTPFLGLIAILASLLGIASSYYVKKNNEIAGVGFIIATMFVIVGADYINVLSAIFLIVAGISALFRK